VDVSALTSLNDTWVPLPHTSTTPTGAELPDPAFSSMAHIRPSPPQPPLLPCDKDDASPRLSQLLQTLADSDPAAPRRRRHAFHSGPLLRRQHPRPCKSLFSPEDSALVASGSDLNPSSRILVLSLQVARASAFSVGVVYGSIKLSILKVSLFL